jgi:hypothetical protein
MFKMYGWHQNHISNYVFLFQKILYFKIIGSINIFHKPMLHMYWFVDSDEPMHLHWYSSKTNVAQMFPFQHTSWILALKFFQFRHWIWVFKCSSNGSIQ